MWLWIHNHDTLFCRSLIYVSIQHIGWTIFCCCWHFSIFPVGFAWLKKLPGGIANITSKWTDYLWKRHWLRTVVMRYTVVTLISPFMQVRTVIIHVHIHVNIFSLHRKTEARSKFVLKYLKEKKTHVLLWIECHSCLIMKTYFACNYWFVILGHARMQL